MLTRHELREEEWKHIVYLQPPEHPGKQGRPSQGNGTTLKGMGWMPRSGAPWRDHPER